MVLKASDRYETVGIDRATGNGPHAADYVITGQMQGAFK